jgi:2-polyprenyl-3-methyl-5-hydroxy-6-metoxy-1,4-benzoquinol methylase
VPLSKYDIELDIAAAPDTSHAYIVDMVGANKRVLDVGCDTGYLGETLKALGNRVWGVEVNPTTAAEAATKLERVVVGDLEALDLAVEFGEGAFDVIVYGDVLEHLRDPLPVLRQARALLAPGGCVVISTPNVAHGDIRLALLQGRFRYTPLGILDETHTRFFTRESLIGFARDAGMALVELRRTHAPLFGTEQQLTEADFPEQVVAALREDPEATTYQFVVRLIAEGADTYSADIALDLDRTRSESDALRDRLAAVLAELAEQAARSEAELAVRADALGAASDEIRRRDESAAESERRMSEAMRQLGEARGEIEVLRGQLDAERRSLGEARALVAAYEHSKAVRLARASRSFGRRR